jgi:hypothetical protein
MLGEAGTGVLGVAPDPPGMIGLPGVVGMELAKGVLPGPVPGTIAGVSGGTGGASGGIVMAVSTGGKSPHNTWKRFNICCGVNLGRNGSFGAEARTSFGLLAGVPIVRWMYCFKLCFLWEISCIG